MSKREITHFFSPTSKPSSSNASGVEHNDSETDGNVSTTVKKKARVSGKFRDMKMARWLEQFEWLDIDTGEHLMDSNISRVWCRYCRFTKEKSDFASEQGKLVEKKETLKEHATSLKHLRAKDKYLAKPAEVSSLVKAFGNTRTTGDNSILTEMKIKMNIAYLIAKQELPFSLFPSLLLLHRKNGVDINPTYDNTHKCSEMIGTIAERMRNDLAGSIRHEAKYLSILIDGDTDRAMQECEIVYMRRVDKSTGKPIVNLVGQKEIQHAHAEGIVTATKTLCDKVDETWKQKLIGFGADGASVNLGRNRSVYTLLRDEVQYTVSLHCMPHRLELVMLAVQKTVPMVKNVHDVLNMVWKTYHYSPKSRRELASLAKELGVDVYTPKSVSGTRWAPHVERALRVFLSAKQVDQNNPSDVGQYAAVLAHTEHLAATTRNADIKGRAQKVIRDMTTLRFAAFCHFLLDLFSQIASLSRTLQANEVILPQAIQAVKSCIATIELMKEHKLENGSLDHFYRCTNIQETDNAVSDVESEACEGDDDVVQNVTYQDVTLKGNQTQVKKQIQKAITETCDKTVKELKHRFENLLGTTNSQGAAKAVACLSMLFNHDAWPDTSGSLMSYGQQEIAYLVEWFGPILQRNGCEIESVAGEWRQLKLTIFNQFMNKSLSGLWSLLLTKEPYCTEFKNVLHLVEIMIALPISTAQCERGFSAQGRIKTAARTRLNPETVGDLIRISLEGPDIANFDPTVYAESWLNESTRARRPNAKLSWPENIVCVGDSQDDSSDNENLQDFL